MTLDTPTIFVVGATICIAAASLQALAAAVFRSRALWSWTGSNLAMFAACSAFAAVRLLPAQVFVPLLYSSLLISVSLISAGLDLFFRRRVNLLETLIGPVIVAGGCLLLTSEQDHPWRVMLAALGLDYYLIKSAGLLLAHRPLNLGGIRTVCALSIVAFATFYTVRNIALVFGLLSLGDPVNNLSGGIARALGLTALATWNVVSVVLPADLIASLDDLTGLLSRRSVWRRGMSELKQAVVRQRQLSVLMVDLDHFKSINDRFGHRRGDDVLRAFGRLATRAISEAGFAGRVGGEEFCVVLPGASADEAREAAERLRAECESHLGDGVEAEITVSIGTATGPAGAVDFSALVDRADQALYAAKTSGRNRIVCA